MTIQNFITDYVQNSSPYVLTKQDENIIRHEGIESYILQKLNSSKYRAAATDPEYAPVVIEKIALTVKKKLPLHILLPFGGVKNAHIPTGAHINWAEVFNIAYIRDYLKPIAAAYEHGVKLEYYSGAIFQRRVNNIPVEDTDQYTSEFEGLIEYFQKFLPPNMTLSFSSIEDTFPRDTVERALSEKVEELRTTWDNTPEDKKAYKILRARRNFRFDSARPDTDETILDSVFAHDAFSCECWATDGDVLWNKKEVITIGHNYTTGWAIHVRSCRGSSVHFWSGMGILVEDHGTYIPSILSLTQYNAVKDSCKIERLDLFSDELPLGTIPYLA